LALIVVTPLGAMYVYIRHLLLKKVKSILSGWHGFPPGWDEACPSPVTA
jgi:hypothetical protein